MLKNAIALIASGVTWLACAHLLFRIAAAMILIAVSTSGSAQPQNFNRTVVPGTGSCSEQNSRCEAFCQTQRPYLGDRMGCQSDCSWRQAECLKTGIYYWINVPSVGGLEKK